jgi:hypothetical protein
VGAHGVHRIVVDAVVHAVDAHQHGEGALSTGAGTAGDRREQTDFRTGRLTGPGAVLAGFGLGIVGNSVRAPVARPKREE